MNKQKMILAIMLALSAQAVKAEQGFFIGGGLGYHDESADCPEVCYGSNEIAIFEAGHAWKVTKDVYIEVKYLHQSNPTIKEDGLGFNGVLAAGRIYL